MSEHYKQYPSEFEPVRIIRQANFNFNLGNVFKYVARRKFKGSEIRDLEKAIHYTQIEKDYIMMGKNQQIIINSNFDFTSFKKFCTENDTILYSVFDLLYNATQYSNSSLTYLDYLLQILEKELLVVKSDKVSKKIKQCFSEDKIQ